MSARLEWSTTYGAYTMYTPYNKDFVEMFKKNIPWIKTKQLKNAAGKHECWLIQEDVVPNLLPVMKLFWPYTQHITKAEVEQKAAAEQARKQAESEAIAEKLRQAGAAQANSNNYIPPQSRSITPIALLCEEWVKLLPYAAAKRAMIEASKILHPDVNNGDKACADALASLNSKWNEIEKILKK